MFARSFARSTSALRSVGVGAPRVFIPRASMAGFADKSDTEKKNLRKSLLSGSQINVSDEVAKLRVPDGISPALSRILMPLLDFAVQEKSIGTVRDELQALTARVQNPMEYEYFEHETNTGTLEELSPATLAAVQELHSTKHLKRIPDLFEAYMFMYSQLSNERNVSVILPSKPSKEELDILEHELKAFYFKNPNIVLTLDVKINPAIGSGRIYCFGDYMLDLTTTDFTKNLRAAMNASKNDFHDCMKELEELYRKPVNSDLAPKNTLTKEGFEKYSGQVLTACGLQAAK